MSRITLTAAAALLAVSGLVGAAPAHAAEPAPIPRAAVTVDGDQVTITTDTATLQATCDKAGTKLRLWRKAATKSCSLPSLCSAAVNAVCTSR